MRFRLCYETAFLILALFSGTVSAATYTKTATIPPAATVLGTGTPNMAANILEVGMSGVEYIPSTASESRAVANVSKGLRIPTSGIVSSLKTGLKANIPSLLASGVIAGIVAGVDWIQGPGGQIQKNTKQPYPGTDLTYFPNRADTSCTALFSGVTGPGIYPVNPAGAGSPDATYYVVSMGAPYLEAGLQYVNNCNPYYVSYGALSNNPASLPTTATPLQDSDYDVLDGFVKGQDGVWQQSLANEVCKSSSNYESCVQNMGAVPYVTGPVSVSSPEVTTETATQNPDGTSTQVTTKSHTDYSLGYPSSSPGSITVDPKTSTQTTTTTKDANGTTISTGTKTDTTTTTQPGSGTQLADGTFNDTPFPDVGPFYKQQFPGGFKDVWAKNKAAFDSSPFVSFLHSFVPSFSGSCPTWSLSFDIMAYAHFGSRQFGSLCYIFDIVKVIMLVTAMFTCRSIIFGG
jgi:hypothetical protein